MIAADAQTFSIVMGHINSRSLARSNHHELGFAADKIVLLQRISRNDLPSDVTLNGNGSTARVLARAGRRPGQPWTRDGRIVLPLRESRQQVGDTAGFLRSGHADSLPDLATPDRSASRT